MESDFESQIEDMDMIDELDEQEIQEVREEWREIRRFCDIGRGPWVVSSTGGVNGEGVYVDGKWDDENQVWYPAYYISTLGRWVRYEGCSTSTKEAAIEQGLKEIEFLCETYIPSLDKDTPPSD